MTVISQPPTVVASCDAELKRRATGVFALFFLLVLSAPAQQPDPVHADMVLLNGKVVTLEDTAPQVEAVAISGRSIVALGSSAEIRRRIAPHTQVIDLGGALV